MAARSDKACANAQGIAKSRGFASRFRARSPRARRKTHEPGAHRRRSDARRLSRGTNSTAKAAPAAVTAECKDGPPAGPLVGECMLKIEPNPEREQLGFRDAVLSSFKFLAEFRLRPVEKKMTFVRYQSRHVFVNVYHGRASYELGIQIGRLADPKKTLSI